VIFKGYILRYAVDKILIICNNVICNYDCKSFPTPCVRIYVFVGQNVFGKEFIMRTFRSLLCLFLLLVVSFGAVACDNGADTPDDVNINENSNNNNNDNASVKPNSDYTLGNIWANISDYTLVYPADSSDSINSVVSLLSTTIVQKNGHKLEVKQQTADEAVDPNAPEILLGNTTREESATAISELNRACGYSIKQIGNKICIVGMNDTYLRNGAIEFLSVFFGYTAPKAFHNVVEFGAVGDGSTDDTKAFRLAISEAQKDGLPVYVPGGKYLITNTLSLSSVTMYGYPTGAWTADNQDLPTLIHKNTDLPLINVIGGSVSGLNLDVEGINENTTKAAETIRVSDVGGRVSNMRIYKPYIGISATKNNPGRCFLENIFIVQAWNTGVEVSGTKDVATLCNIEVWNYNTEHPCPTAYKFGDNDDIRAVNLFAFNAKVGFAYTHDGDGGCWGSFTNCSVDFTVSGIEVSNGTHHLTFTGGTYWSHYYGLTVKSTTSANTLVTMTGSEIKTNGGECVKIEGGYMSTLTGCNIRRVDAAHSVVPIKINGGRAILVNGNNIGAAKIAVQVGQNFKGLANITGNTILSGAAENGTVISNLAKTSSTVLSEGNAILKEQAVN